MEQLRQIWERGGIRVESDCPLSAHGTFHIGGAARLAVLPATREQMLTVLDDCRRTGHRPLVIGRGSNVVFDDAGYDGIVLLTGAWREAELNGTQLRASAGCSLIALSARARDAGLSGLEFACGIPATLGGAVFMNAGAYGSSMSQICTESEYYDLASGKVCVLRGEAQAFGVRTSAYLQNPDRIVLGAALQLTPDHPEQIRSRMETYRAKRSATQPCELPSAGSVFKHPVGHFAGKLIEDCGLKGYTVGGAQVSVKHAGFIVNCGGATSQDVRRLVTHIRETVLSRFGVELECEIRFLPAGEER